jgi:hypothetical protein
VYLHETLTTGILALLAAGVTVGVIKRQIKQAERLHADALLRRNNAARAVLPIALSKLSAYGLASIHYAQTLRIAEKFAGSPPQVSDEVIGVFRDLIETTADDDVSHAFRALISRLQIQVAGVRDLAPSPLKLIEFDLDEAVEDVILESAELHVHVSKFFDYSRFKNNNAPIAPLRADVEAKLNFWRLNKESEPKLWNRLTNEV